MPRLLWLHPVHILHMSFPRLSAGGWELILVQGGLGFHLSPSLTSCVPTGMWLNLLELLFSHFKMVIAIFPYLGVVEQLMWYNDLNAFYMLCYCEFTWCFIDKRTDMRTEGSWGLESSHPLKLSPPNPTLPFCWLKATSQSKPGGLS